MGLLFKESPPRPRGSPSRDQPAEIFNLNHAAGDLVSELRRRLEALWRYGECVAKSEVDPELQQKWRDLQRLEQFEIERLKQRILDQIEKGEYPNEF